MIKIKKITAIILSIIMVVCCFGVQASAASVFSGAKKMEQLEYYNVSNIKKRSGKTVFYKISLPSSGTVEFRWALGGCLDGRLFDSSGKTIADKFYIGYYDKGTKTIKDLNKGVYYLELSANDGAYISGDTEYVKDLYYTFIPDEEPTIKLAVTLKKGSTLNLGAITDNYSGKVSFISTKTSVATVKSGTVKAVAKGQATIRATLDDGTYAEIKIFVK